LRCPQTIDGPYRAYFLLSRPSWRAVRNRRSAGQRADQVLRRVVGPL